MRIILPIVLVVASICILGRTALSGSHQPHDSHRKGVTSNPTPKPFHPDKNRNLTFILVAAVFHNGTTNLVDFEGQIVSPGNGIPVLMYSTRLSIRDTAERICTIFVPRKVGIYKCAHHPRIYVRVCAPMAASTAPCKNRSS